MPKTKAAPAAAPISPSGDFVPMSLEDLEDLYSTAFEHGQDHARGETGDGFNLRKSVLHWLRLHQRDLRP